LLIISQEGYYSDRVIEEIRTSNDIVDVVGDYVQLKKKGKYLFGFCPFHSESSASFSVTPSKQMFYCFSCGRGGGVFQFVMQIEGLNFAEAILFLANRAKIVLPEKDEHAQKLQHERNKNKEINRQTAKFFFTCLKQNDSKEAIRYLKNRDVGLDVIKRFGVGYAPNKRDLLYRYLIEKGVDCKDILSSGLVTLTKNGEYVDRFRNRIMFPMFNAVGEIIGFGGRTIDSTLPKYINSPETVLYAKGKNLYGLNFAKGSGEDTLIVVEGYMDVISLHKHGITNVVAAMGTALTEYQGRLLRRYADKIIIAFDSDAAGQKATMRGLDLLAKMGCDVKVLILPSGKDPDEFINNNGKEKFRALLRNAMTLVDYKIGILKKSSDTGSTEGTVEFLDKTAIVLSKITNDVERELQIKKLSKEYQVNERALYSEVYKKIAFNKPKLKVHSWGKMIDRRLKSRSNINEKASNEQVHYYEKILLILLCIDNSIYARIKDMVSQDDFDNQHNKCIAQMVFNKFSGGANLQLAELLDAVENEHANEFAKIAYEDCNFDDNFKAAQDVIRKMHDNKTNNRQKEILNKLSNNNDSLDENEILQLKRELNELIVKKKKNIN